MPIVSRSYTAVGGHEVSELVDKATNVVATERWRLNDLLSRTDAPAEIKRDRQSGAVVTENWFLDGHPHRENGPAMLTLDPIGQVVTREVWYLQGELQRDGGPCILERSPLTGKVVFEVWLRDGVKDRDDAPAVIYRGADGKPIRDEWWSDGQLVKEAQYGPFEPKNYGNARQGLVPAPAL